MVFSYGGWSIDQNVSVILCRSEIEGGAGEVLSEEVVNEEAVPLARRASGPLGSLMGSCSRFTLSSQGISDPSTTLILILDV